HLLRRRCRRYIFGSIGLGFHRSLGLVVATIGPCQSGTAKEGCDTQCQDETKNSLHIGLLFCVGCPLDYWNTTPDTTPLPQILSSTQALAQQPPHRSAAVFTASAPAVTPPSRTAPVVQTDLGSQSAGPASVPQQRRRH